VAFDLLGTTHTIVREADGRLYAACGWSIRADGGSSSVANWQAGDGERPTCLGCRNFLYAPSSHVLNRFGLRGRPTQMPGHSGAWYRVGDAVLVPVGRLADGIPDGKRRRAVDGADEVDQWSVWDGGPGR
jgi:hypothetical protein